MKKGVISFFVMMAVLCLMLFCMMGCSPKVVIVPEVHTEYISKTDTFISVQNNYVHDSVLVQTKGDTVLVDRWHTQYRDRDVLKVKTDTMIQRDSVPVPYPVEVKPSLKERAGTAAIWFVLGGIITFVIFLLLRAKKMLF